MTPKQRAQLDIALDLLDELINAAKEWSEPDARKLVEHLDLRHSQAHDSWVDAKLRAESEG